MEKAQLFIYAYGEKVKDLLIIEYLKTLILLLECLTSISSQFILKNFLVNYYFLFVEGF